MTRAITTFIIFLFIGASLGFTWVNYTGRKSFAGAGAGSSPSSAAVAGQNPHSQDGSMAEIQNLIRQAEENKGDFDLQIRVAQLFDQINREDKVAEYLENAAKLNPREFEKIFVLGNAFFDIGDYSRAREYYLKADQMRPSDPDVLTPLGVTALAGDPPDYEEGFKRLEHALKINPRHEAALVNLGLGYSRKGDRAKTREIRRRLAGVNPSSQYLSVLDSAVSQ